MKQHLFTISIVLLLAVPVQAQKSVYVALSNSKGYVVGAKLRQSGLFRFDGDTTWTHIGWNHPFIGGVAFANRSDGIIHAAAGNGEMRSLDGGESWRITTGWEVTEAQDVALDRIDRDRVYLATSYGIWRSRNDGDNWKQVYEGYTQAISTDVFTERRIIAATEAGLKLSRNGGDEWQTVGPEVAMVDVDQSDSHPLEWIAVSRDNGVFRSDDGGHTWNHALDLEAEGTAVSIHKQAFETQAVATWGQGVFVTTDGGNTWRQAGDGLPVPIVTELAFDGNRTGRLWAATMEAGIFYTDDLGASWTFAGMNGTLVFDITFAE